MIIKNMSKEEFKNFILNWEYGDQFVLESSDEVKDEAFKKLNDKKLIDIEEIEKDIAISMNQQMEENEQTGDFSHFS